MDRVWSKPVSEESTFRAAFDPDYIADFADRLSAIGLYSMGFRPAGTEAGHRAGELIAAEMQRIGLHDVRREPFPVYAWDFRGAEITVHGPGGRTMPASSYPPTPGTPPGGLTTTLVDVGLGTAADYLGRDVRGKLAFARLDVDVMRWPGVLAYEAELHGAAGIVFYYLNGYAQHPSGAALNTHDGMGRDTIPAIQVSVNDGRELAQALAGGGEVQATLVSRVEAAPQGRGHNVVGVLPGRRFPDRFLVVGAHYDAWFSGYWDNASGVAGMLTIAQALVASGYEPAHTLVFVATDAEEFGAPDSIFDWLVGAQALLESHAEWPGQVSCCFNFDTLCLQAAEWLRLYGSAEMSGFVRQATSGPDLRLSAFPQPQAQVDDYVTPWTETYSWTYFGVPVIQPSFDRGTVGETHYHTQFDRRDILNFAKSNEAVRLYGSLLVRLDQQPLLPYSFGARAEAMRASVDWELARSEELAPQLADALERLAERASQVERTVAAANSRGWPDLSPHQEGVDAANQELRQAAAYLLRHCSYLGGDFCHTVLYRHEHRQQHLAALKQAVAALEVGDARQALVALTDRQTGLPGAFFGQYASYRTYHHFVVGAVSPGRPNLFWGRDRALPTLDCWTLIADLKDKLARSVTDFDVELFQLCAWHEEMLGLLHRDLSYLINTADTAAKLLPVEALEALARTATE